ncbi:molybdate ABC transporter substrate-binding protein [Actomonas aquatica]|uniref:Molybdate ABC transporter substrate-binding protein n=1 Tax=Actomonas aquatica TaxID=2866162 RepID=A0ABZ1C571_9BACT|nr:molybdate ABC transporter substrate-binding protein [Opitutus sp. WL0086]WRQ86877.1 molybdate ABC transporter substrate-binding protein [Opitutus sp. WL0086]
MSRVRRVIVGSGLLGLLALSTLAASPRPLRVAAAANMTRVMAPLEAAFEAAHPELDLRASFGATGNLVAQIRHGAPFDVFLAADPDHPATLVASGDATADSVIPFATGQLVLWPTPHGAPADWTQALLDPAVRRIAIAQPDTAPFGRAARQLLREAELWDALQPRLVTGENVAQTLHFVASGNADYGFVALSLLVGNAVDSPADCLVLTVETEALNHTAVILHRASSREDAQVFLDWLLSPPAQTLLQQHGYAPPPAPPATNPGIDD